jgi:hypothetical protein
LLQKIGCLVLKVLYFILEKEELAFKRSQKNVATPKVFFTYRRKNPHRGMGWVNAQEPINKGKLGYAQSWKYQKERKYHYYD